MSLSTPVFLTNRSDYHSLVLFRHIRQQLIAAQTGAVKIICSDAASKPENEFHYLGLLWNCAFKAGIASMGVHSKPASLLSPSVITAPISPKILPVPTCDLSVLQPSTGKPFGSLHCRFCHHLQVPAPVQIVLLQTEKVPVPVQVALSLDSFLSYPEHCPPCLPSPSSIPLHQPPDIHRDYSELPVMIPLSHLPPDKPPLKAYLSNEGQSASGSSVHQPLWFSLRPKIPCWIQLPLNSHPYDEVPTSISRA